MADMQKISTLRVVFFHTSLLSNSYNMLFLQTKGQATRMQLIKTSYATYSIFFVLFKELRSKSATQKCQRTI